MQDVQDVPSFCWVARGCSSAPGLIARVSNKYPSKRILKSYLDMRTWFSGSTKWDDFPLGTTGYHLIPQVVKDDFLGAIEAQLQCSGLGLMAHPLTWMGNRPKGRSDTLPFRTGFRRWMKPLKIGGFSGWNCKFTRGIIYIHIHIYVFNDTCV